MGKHRDRQGKCKHAFNFSKTCTYERAGAGINNLPLFPHRRSGRSDFCLYLLPQSLIILLTYVYLYPHQDTYILIIEMFLPQSYLLIYQGFYCYHRYLNTSNTRARCCLALGFVLFNAKC